MVDEEVVSIRIEVVVLTLDVVLRQKDGQAVVVGIKLTNLGLSWSGDLNWLVDFSAIVDCLSTKLIKGDVIVTISMNKQVVAQFVNIVGVFFSPAFNPRCLGSEKSWIVSSTWEKDPVIWNLHRVVIPGMVVESCGLV